MPYLARRRLLSYKHILKAASTLGGIGSARTASSPTRHIMLGWKMSPKQSTSRNTLTSMDNLKEQYLSSKLIADCG